jgi:soluble lytic murein transglycosylase-like protein
VRIGSVNPEGLRALSSGPLGRWSRNLISLFALIASMAALALILESQYGQALFGGSLQRAGAAAEAMADPNDLPQAAARILSAAEERRYRALSEFVANRYRVSQDVAFDLIGLAHQVGGELQLDPLLIIAVIAIESRFNPIAESVAGAKGLMQIIPKYHTQKLQEFGGVEAVFDPVINVQVGAQILKEYLRHTGHIGSALQMYNGALSDTDDHYTNKVMNEKQRLQQVVSQALRRATPAPTPKAAPMRTAAVRGAHAFASPLD